jgi:hypothetical protein
MAKSVHYTVDVPRGMQRFRELIVYISGRCASDPHFGTTKLNKILYHADFRAFERFGVPLTGMKYFKLPFGPAPKAMLPVLGELEAEGAISRDPPPKGEHDQRKTYARREAHMDHFTEDEIDLIEEVIQELAPHTATKVSADSHGVAWKARHMRDEIPYEAAFLLDESPTADDIMEARELNSRYEWGLRV